MAYSHKNFRKKKTLLDIINGKRKQRPPSDYQRAKALLDTVFQAYIRSRDRLKYGNVCPICHTKIIEVCFHFEPRGCLPLRWEPDAACGSCAPCNGGEMINRGRTTIYRDAWVRIAGEKRVLELEAMRYQPFKKSAAEIVDMVAHFKQLIAGGK
jgi:hypothetical protein